MHVVRSLPGKRSVNQNVACEFFFPFFLFLPLFFAFSLFYFSASYARRLRSESSIKPRTRGALSFRWKLEFPVRPLFSRALSRPYRSSQIENRIRNGEPAIIIHPPRLQTFPAIKLSTEVWSPPQPPRPHALSKNIILARTLSSASASSRKPSPRDYIAGRLCSLYSKEVSLSENLLNDDDAGMTSSIRIHQGCF